MKKSFVPLVKTLSLASCLCMAAGYVSFVIQTEANKRVSSCSYLDPITIDIVAFVVAAFLFIEALAAIFRHKDSNLASQFTRCLRMCIGTSIVMVHILQFLYKNSSCQAKLS